MLRDKRNTVARKTRKYTAVVNFFFKLKLSDLSLFTGRGSWDVKISVIEKCRSINLVVLWFPEN